jgi:pimeloyl-ACP methyl ester carboxylesterase
MIHGLFTSLAVYYFTIAPKLARDHRVVLYDLRGHGNSAECDRSFSFDDLIDDLLELKASLGIDRCHLVGYSLGGALALCATALYPDDFDSLALIEAPLFDEDSSEEMRMSGGSEAFVAQGLRDYTKSTHIKVSQERALRIQEQYRTLFEVGGLADVFLQGRERLALQSFELVTQPVLLLYGKQSSLRATGRFLARTLPQSQLRCAYGDHQLPVTRYRWVSRHLKRFFKQS